MIRLLLMCSFGLLFGCEAKENPCQAYIDARCACLDSDGCDTVLQEYGTAQEGSAEADYCEVNQEAAEQLASECDAKASGGDADADADADAMCSDSCETPEYNGDGVCDDGGTGSSFHACAYGTDCSDCGTRAVCNDECEYAVDDECDDGFEPYAVFDEAGELPESDACESGTDCSDCGARY